MSVDYNEKTIARKKQAESYSKSGKFPASTKYKDTARSNNKNTGYVTSGGGAPSINTIQNYDSHGMQTTKVSRPVNTGYMKDHQVTKGGGVTSIKNVHGNTDVSPEC
jgi:hypothetical protein